MNLLLKEIIEVLDASSDLDVSEIKVEGVSIDTRTISRGDLFFAIKGENFDGGDFIEEAKVKGAVGAVVSGEVSFGSDDNFKVIKVEDSVGALGDLAKYYRNKLGAKVIAVTGSVGKTTTKDFIYDLLVSGGFKTVKTLGNFNNLIGLPLSIFRLVDDTEYGVFELGISEVGEMEKLADITGPNCAVITNIGRGHLEGLGTAEVVAREKLKLFSAVRDGGVVVINADDVRLSGYELPDSMADRGVTKKTFGFSGAKKPDVEIKNISREGGGLVVVYSLSGVSLEAVMATPYECNACNGASAIGAVVALIKDFDTGAIKAGLESYSGGSGRMSVIDAGGIIIIDDTYNSNPESLKEALKTLSCMEPDVDGESETGRARGRKIAVIGDMLELGDVSKPAHREAGAAAGELGIDIVIAVGEFAGDVIEGAKDGSNMETFSAANAREVSSLITGIVKPGDTVLVKGSHSMGLEKVVERLKKI